MQDLGGKATNRGMGSGNVEQPDSPLRDDRFLMVVVMT